MLGLTEDHERRLRAQALLALDEWAPIGRDIRFVLTKWSLEGGCHDETMEWMEELGWPPGRQKDAAIQAVIDWAVVHLLRKGEVELLLSDPYPPVRMATVLALGGHPIEPPTRMPGPLDHLRQDPPTVWRR